MNTGLASSKRFVLVLGLLTGLVAFAIDISLPAIPPMVHDLATSMSLGQHVVGLFVAGMAFGQIPAGLMSDRIGRMPVLYVGVALFIVAGIVTSLSHNITVILVARFVQGIGSSVGMVLARAIVRDIASGKQAARLLTIMVMIFTAAPMIAPLLGSFLVNFWGWQLPFAATTLAGVFILVGIKSSLRETHVPDIRTNFMTQLVQSIRTFVSHKKCIFGILIILATIAGVMSLISASSAFIIEMYGFPVHQFGYIFALTGVAILIGSNINRRLLNRFDSMQMIGIGATILGIASVQLLFIAWLGDAQFWWIWANVCLYMAGTGFIFPNATAMALDPVPEIAGVAASVIGTTQSAVGALAAVVSSALYTGTILNLTIGVGASGMCAWLIYVFRGRILR